jgi:5-methylcytosine-specific restriction endonuclease McrA
MKQKRRLCHRCHQSFLARVGQHSGLCDGCRLDPRMVELERLAGQISRAQGYGVPATLTLDIWLAIIQEFQGLCAYCQEQPFEVLDHFYSISRGAGTTPGNCVPACIRCKVIKDSKGKSRLAMVAQIERIDAYLEPKREIWDRPFV